MTTRRTSVYTIRFPEPTPALIESAARSLYGIGVVDRGEASVSFRASGDQHALLTAADVMAGLDDPWTLTTGLGIHRREVTT